MKQKKYPSLALDQESLYLGIFKIEQGVHRLSLIATQGCKIVQTITDWTHNIHFKTVFNILYILILEIRNPYQKLSYTTK